MEIQKTVRAPREYIYDKIVESCLYDISQQTGKKPSIHNLQGFEYSKRFGQNQTGRIKIDELDGTGIYAFTTATTKNTFKTRWELHKIDSTTTNIIIDETHESHGFFQRMNDAAIGTLMFPMKRRRYRKILEGLEKAYQG